LLAYGEHDGVELLTGAVLFSLVIESEKQFSVGDLCAQVVDRENIYGSILLVGFESTTVLQTPTQL
jgi:hypothetical protein